MAIDYFLGRSEQELRGWLRAAQDAFVAGKQTVEVAGSGYSAKFELKLEPRIVIQFLLEKLNSMFPNEFPIDSITPDTVTRVVFTPSLPNVDAAGNPIP